MTACKKTNITRTCRLGSIANTRRARFACCSKLGHALPDAISHAIAGFVYYPIYSKLQGTMKSGSLTGWLQQFTDCQLNINQTALADCKNLIRHKTCNPAPDGFRRTVEILPNPDPGLVIGPYLVVILIQYSGTE